jgi:ABC-2 type transport system permease protein
MLSALIGRSIGRARALLIALSGVLVLFQVFLVIAAAYFEESRAFSQIAAFLPMAVQQMVGAAVFVSFKGFASFGYFHPIVIITFVGSAIYLASEPAGDVETGMVDVILARPVRRALVITRSLAAMMIGTVAMAALMFIASRAAIAAFAPAGAALPPAAALLRLDANLIAVAWVFGSLALAISAVARRRAAAAGSAGVVALILYLLNFLSGVWPKAQAYGPLSPFHYYDAVPIMMGQTARWMPHLLTLLAMSAALCAVAYFSFSRRDV